MRGRFLPSLAALAALSITPMAYADDAADRSAAVSLCRAEAAVRAGVPVEEVRLDTMRTRARAIRVDLDIWIDGQLANIRCDVARGSELQITALNLPENREQAAR